MSTQYNNLHLNEARHPLEQGITRGEYMRLAEVTPQPFAGEPVILPKLDATVHASSLEAVHKGGILELGSVVEVKYL